MTKQIINVGSGELTGDGESLRAAFVKVNNNFGEVYTAVDNINNAGYLTTSTLPNNLGNLTVTDQTITGNDVNGNITLAPNGTGTVNVTSLTFDGLGAVINSSVATSSRVFDTTLTAEHEHTTSNANTLTSGTYQGINIDITGPYTVLELATDNSLFLIGDIVGGAGLVNFSHIIALGTGSDNHIVVVDKGVPFDLTANQYVTVTRPATNPALNIKTEQGVNLSLGSGSDAGTSIVANNDMVPAFNNTYNLGHTDLRWKNVWVGPGSVFITDEVLGIDLELTARNGNLVAAGSAGLDVGEFILHDNSIIIKDLNRDFIIGQSSATGSMIVNRPIKVVSGSTGRDTFTVSREGIVTIITPTLAADVSAVNIVASANGATQTAVTDGVLLHLTGQEDIKSRIMIDAASVNTADGADVTGRRSRGTAAGPSAIQSGDTIFTLQANGYDTLGYATTAERASIEFVASEDYTSTDRGAKIVINTIPQGQRTQALSLSIDETGVSFVGNTTGGVTFSDSTVQTTAWTGTVQLSQIPELTSGAVTRINVGNGLVQTTSTGIVGIDSTDVQTVVGTANRVIVTDSGSKNLTLTLPQDIATTSSVTFQNITVTGNINVLGTSTVAQNSVIQGKILYLASSATNLSQIDGGGIQLGTSTFAKSILYSQSHNAWEFGTTDLHAADVEFTGTATIASLRVNDSAHFGTAYEEIDYPNAEIQIDSNVNSYSQLVYQNHNTGTNASTDFVAANDIGSDSNNYIDMGINSSVYSNPDYSIGGANAGYLYINGGDLTLGTQSAGQVIKLHTGGTTSDRLRVTISDAGLNVLGTVNGLTLPGTTSTSGYVLSNNGSGVTSWVQPQTGFVGSRGVTGFTGSAGANGTNGTTGFTGSAGANGTTGFTGSRGTDGVVGYNGSIGYTGSRGDTGTGYTGSIGSIGGTGYTGSAGTNGTTGFAGSQGNQGITGFVGSAGTNGTNGTNGFTGSSGVQGNQGFTGSQGTTGTTGATGYTGSKGDQGSLGGTGYTGSQGGLGYTGSQGVGYTGSASTASGYTGSVGGIGFTGSAGTNGTNGTNGFTGSQGIQGTTGAAGYTGSVGIQGQTGATGYTGSKGDAGTNGTNGTNGTTGFTGSAGNNGTNGFTGSAGTNGTNGFTGSKGDLGYSGSQGIQGITGNNGYTGSASTVVGYTGSQGVGYTGSASTVAGPTGFTGSVGFTGSSGVNGVTSITGGNNIVLSTSTGAVSITRVDGLQTLVTASTTATYTLLTTDQYFGTNRPSTGAITVTLPVGSTVPAGRQYVIKDESGNAAAGGRNITVSRGGSDLIDGTATRIINSNYGSLTVMWTGSTWSRI